MALRLSANVFKVARCFYSSRSFAVGTTNLKKSFEFRTPVLCNMTARNFSSNLPEIATYEEVKKLPKNPSVLLIDVREKAELDETGVVPTSINIPLGQVKDKLATSTEEEFLKLFNRKKPSLDTEIIFMCKIGGRSGKAMEIARQLGFKNSRNYLGSWEEWKVKEGLPK